MTRTVLFVCGGSVGHCAPAVAVWNELARLRRDLRPLFVCAPRADEEEFLASEGVPFVAVALPRRSPSLPVTFLRALRAAGGILDREHPAAVLGKGGALTLPVCLAARMRGIPVVVHESDAVMGWANRLVAPFATTVCMGMEGEPPRRNAVFTGNPVRAQVRAGRREEGLRITGLSGARPVLLVMGGSQGAAALNAWVSAHLDELLAACDIVHIAGRGKDIPLTRPGYWHRAFVTAELPHLYALSTLAVSRAGAGGIGELAAARVPGILVPIAGLAGDHQVRNARAAQAGGGFVVRPQEEMRRHLFADVTSLLADQPRRERMQEHLAAMDRPAAALQIAEEVSLCVARES